MSADIYTIREARLDEQAELSTFLVQHFTPRVEPPATYFSKYEQKLDEAEETINEERRKRRHKNSLSREISKSPCHVAIHNESKKIVGVSLMAIHKNPKFQECTHDHKISTGSGSPTPARSKIEADFIKYVFVPLKNNVGFFAKFPKLRVTLELAILSVDSNYGGQGLATRLIDESVKYADSKGIELVYGIFTSRFSQRAAEKNGFQTVSNIDPLSFRDGEGNVIFKDTKPFVASVMARCLQPTSSGAQHGD